jgi:hypothetical protein
MQICNGAAATDARRLVGKGSKFGKSRARSARRLSLRAFLMIGGDRRAHFGHTSALLNPCVAFEH